MKILAALLLFTALDPVRISVSATTLMAGSELKIICYVRPEKSNEWLEIGVENDHVSLESVGWGQSPDHLLSAVRVYFL